MINKKYVLSSKIGEGSFGSIYRAKNYRTQEEVAVKVEPIKEGINLLKNETNIYQYLLGTYGVPHVKWYGKDDDNYYMVINLLGKSLQQLLTENTVFSLRLTLQIGIQLIQILKSIHKKGIIHRDIKPDNFLLGLKADDYEVEENKEINNDKKKNNQFYLIDFGLCKPYKRENNEHIEMKKTNGLIGSLTYASLNSHRRIQLSRRDDLESLGYMLVYFNMGRLSWRELGKEVDIVRLKELVIRDTAIPLVLRDFIQCVRNLEFKETPNYELFIYQFLRQI